MKSQSKQIIILAVILVVALAVYAGLRVWNAGGGTAGSGEEDTFVSELKEITEITFVSPAGESFSFTKDGENWTYPADAEFPLNQGEVETIENVMGYLKAKRVFEEPDALSTYGLDPAVSTVTAVTASGETRTILIGNEVESEYYAAVEGEGTVYTISSTLPDAINKNLAELAETDVFPDLSEGNLQTVALTNAQGETVLSNLVEKRQEEQEQDTGEVDENGDPIMETVTATVEYYHWSLADGTQVPEENEALSALLTELEGLSFYKGAAYKPTEEELVGFGLDNPQVVLSVTCVDGSQFTLSLGGTDEDGSNYYARMDGSDLVCLLPCADVSTCVNTGADAFTQ